jgi:hypothetical protein
MAEGTAWEKAEGQEETDMRNRSIESNSGFETMNA